MMSLSRMPRDEEIAILPLRFAEPEAGVDMPHGASSAADDFLDDSFLAEIPPADRPVVCVISRVIAWNAAVVGLVERSVQSAGEPVGVDVVSEVVRVGPSSGAKGTERRAVKRAGQSIGWESLRESELGIAELVAEGLTNREIGTRLFVSRHTVDSHLRHIFWKLGINSRVELTRLVVEHGALRGSRTELVS